MSYFLEFQVRIRLSIMSINPSLKHINKLLLELVSMTLHSFQGHYYYYYISALFNRSCLLFDIMLGPVLVFSLYKGLFRSTSFGSGLIIVRSIQVGSDCVRGPPTDQVSLFFENQFMLVEVSFEPKHWTPEDLKL